MLAVVLPPVAFLLLLALLLLTLLLLALPVLGAGKVWAGWGGRIIDTARPAPARIVLWGDSLAWEARETFSRLATEGGAQVLVRTFGGTAPCDWLADVDVQIRAWRPTVAVLAFSGNTISACMRGRDVATAYPADTGAAVRLLREAGVQVRLVVAPPRPDQPVRADGMTDLDRMWRAIAAAHDGTEVVFADLAVTMRGRWSDRLPCQAGEPCRPDGTVVVRGPDHVHFCPVTVPVMIPCPVFSAGAERYGAAMAAAALPSLNRVHGTTREPPAVSW
ncbi:MULTISPECIES: SGNH/GDSL hydrolase family protein [unclassified Frankia]